MGTNPTKAADNIYCRCRKAAAKYNDKLNSREGAAELLGISPSTLADYDLSWIIHGGISSHKIRRSYRYNHSQYLTLSQNSLKMGRLLL